MTGQFLSIGLSGRGRLTISDGGSVSNSGVAVLGNFAGSNGIALVTGAGSTWAAGANLLIGLGGTGALTIGQGAIVSGQSLTIASQQGSVGVLNLEGGTLQADTIVFGQGVGTINFNAGGTFSFSPQISGAGTLNVVSGKTFLTADSSAFTGDTNIAGGDLIVNGVLGGVISVGNASVLGGTGTVGSTIVGNGGVFSPGNSIGTISVNGNLTFGQGSIYRVEVDPAGNNDKTLVSGIADLTGGHVNVVAAAGNWKAATGYTILSAASGLNGTHFLDVSSNLQFLDPTLTYDASNVMLTMRRNSIAISDLAKTPNQRSAARSIDNFTAQNPASDNPLIGKLLGLDRATAPLTIAQLPGEIHVSLAGVLLDDSRFIRDAVNNRLRSAFGDVTAPSLPVLAYGPDGAEPQPATGDRFAVWGQGFGSWADWKSNDQVPGLDRSLGGFLIGGDVSFGDHTRIGILSGYSHTSIDESSLGASADVDNFHLGIYGGAEFGALSLRSGASYTWHDISTDRSVQFTGSQEHLSADYNGGTAQIFGELGYGIQYNSVTLEPFANFSYANLHLDSFTEEGGASTLTAASSNTDITISTLGLSAATQLSLGSVGAALRGTLGWRHAYGDVTPQSRLAFAGMESFEISGLPIARDAALLEAGLNVDLTPATTFGLSYQGQIASEVQDHGFKANLTVRF
ncbi:autotransporter domain-containing protein [Phyllobacterium sp. LjRoot231]|uniref:autotransporter outer membrane beta-barrel domain-containing protein n=1 Tax=Phyllobacterium sp. LjRoot231 TaxID=3342289 RepID=UPI003ECCC71C